MTGLRVLVVDDDPEFRRLAARVLRGWGMAVAGEAGGVADALAAAERTRPDVVIVDVGLPDGDGFSLTVRLRALSPAPQVVVVSSDGSAAYADEARRVGAKGFVAKVDLTGDRLRDLMSPEQSV